MDPRDAMSIPGPGSYYLPRGLSGGPDGPPGMHHLPNQSIPFRSNIGANSIGSSISLDPHNVNNISLPSNESLKRKRGRPRKYGLDGAGSLGPTPSVSALPTTMTSSSQKRGRGRPPGSGKKQQLASVGDWVSGSAGVGFTPHVITIGVGEDISTKIMSFSHQGPRAVCVLSANGSVSTVTLRQPSTPAGTVTYEGRFEILCLSGSYLLTNNDGSRHRSGGLCVSLASPDGRVIGGGVGGALIAATPIQVIMGSFLSGNCKLKTKTREGTDVSLDSEGQAGDNPFGVWPGSRSNDIDLMRG